MRLTLRKSDNTGDWFIIERAEHEGREWLEEVSPGFERFCTSARFSDNADVEGHGYEMLAIAKAIRDRSSVSCKRCEVRVEGDVAYFRSPRNSQKDGQCTLAEADELAGIIEKRLSEYRSVNH